MPVVQLNGLPVDMGDQGPAISTTIFAEVGPRMVEVVVKSLILPQGLFNPQHF